MQFARRSAKNRQRAGVTERVLDQPRKRSLVMTHLARSIHRCRPPRLQMYPSGKVSPTREVVSGDGYYFEDDNQL